MGLFSKGKIITGTGGRFRPQAVGESTRVLYCPGCGLFHMYTLTAGEDADLEKLGWCMDGAFVLVFYQIGAYRDRALDDQALIPLRRVLITLRDAKKDIILRVAYDNSGKGLEHEPESFERILGHMEQLRDILGSCSDRIYLFQGLFVGSWGEMHTSRYLGTDRLEQLAEKMRDILGPRPYLAFRRPMQYRRLYEKISRWARTGLFDDGILGSDNDLGTFGIQSPEEAGWGNPWRKKEELVFIGKLAGFAPIGGEAVLGDHSSYPYSLAETLELLQKLHVSYLNGDYDNRVYHAWEEMIFTGKGAWRGMNGKDYILRHIGYRYRIRRVEAKPVREGLYLEITVVNEGFSRCYRRIKSYMRTGSGWEWELQGKLEELPPGKELTMGTHLPFSEGALVFGAVTEDGDPVPFANEPSDGWEVLLGEMEEKNRSF